MTLLFNKGREFIMEFTINKDAVENVLYNTGRMGTIPFVVGEAIIEKEDGYYTYIGDSLFKYIHGMWMEIVFH